MFKRSKLRQFIKTIISELKKFFLDESGGNLVEYALLIGLALFIFFIIVGIITSLLDWTMGQTNNFFESLF